MKKFFAALVLIGFLGLMVAPAVALAQEKAPGEVTQCTMRHTLTDQSWKDAGFYCPAKGSDCVFEDTTTVNGYNATCVSCCLMDTIYTITDWIFVGVIAIATIMILWGAFNIITAGGNTEKVNTGRQFIIMALVGFLVAALAKVVPAIAKNILGM